MDEEERYDVDNGVFGYDTAYGGDFWFRGGGGRMPNGITVLDIILAVITVGALVLIAVHFEDVTTALATFYSQILLAVGGLLAIIVGLLLVVLLFRIIFYRRRWY